MEDDTSLWGCLSRVTDLKTGHMLALQLIPFPFGSWASNLTLPASFTLSPRMNCRGAALWGSAASRGCWHYSRRSGHHCTDVCIHIVRIRSSSMTHICTEQRIAVLQISVASTILAHACSASWIAHAGRFWLLILRRQTSWLQSLTEPSCWQVHNGQSLEGWCFQTWRR